MKVFVLLLLFFYLSVIYSSKTKQKIQNFKTRELNCLIHAMEHYAAIKNHCFQDNKSDLNNKLLK